MGEGKEEDWEKEIKKIGRRKESGKKHFACNGILKASCTINVQHHY